MTVSALKIFESKELIPHEIPSTIKKPIKIFEKKKKKLMTIWSLLIVT